MGLFSKPKVPGFDIESLNRMAQESAARQKAQVEGLGMSLAPLSQQYEQKRQALGAGLLPQSEEQLNRFRQELSGIKGLEQQQARQTAQTFREQQFRQVPELQRAVRESLGASGLLQSGRPSSQLAQPTLQAAQASRDLEAQLAAQQLQNEIGRETGLAQTGFGARQQALQQKFGLDSDTISYLTSIGREDLINKANSLLGVEQNLGSQMLANEQLRQQQEIAKAQAKAAGRANILGGLGQLGGAGLGALFGGPLGASIGAQLGGTAANLATGSPVAFDPSLFFALQQQNRGFSPRNPTEAAYNRQALVSALGAR